MELYEAKRELGQNVNLSYSHAVLLRDDKGYETELHSGHAGNCGCDADDNFIWREESVYTDQLEIDDI